MSRSNQAPSIPRLQLVSFSVRRGELVTIHNLDLSLEPGTSIGLVGPNGSGKTSLVEALAGAEHHSGQIKVDGRDVVVSKPAEALRNGIALCPANRGIFHRMTVTENLLVGGHTLRRRSAQERLSSLLRKFPSLSDRAGVLAGQLSGGEKQQLAIARALMIQPRLLLLDEPSRGLSPAAIGTVLDTVDELVSSGVTVLIVDQAVDWMYDRVDRLIVLANGRIAGDSGFGARDGSGDGQSVEDFAAQYFDLR